MTERKRALLRAFTGWVEKTLSGDEGIIFVQHGKGYQRLEDAIRQAKYVKGWVERNGQPAHVESGTRIKTR